MSLKTFYLERFGFIPIISYKIKQNENTNIIHKHYTQTLYTNIIHKHYTQTLYTNIIHKHYTPKTKNTIMN